MSVIRVVTVLCLGLAAPAYASAQEPSASSVLSSAVRARAIVEKGIGAMGGLPRLQRLGSVTRHLAGLRTDITQGPAPDRGSDNRSEMLVVTDIRGQRFLRDARSEILGGQPFHYRLVLAPTGGFIANLSINTARPTPAAAVRDAMAPLLRRWPETILLVAWNRLESLRYLGRDGGEERVSYSDPSGSVVELAFDAATGLLTRSASLYDDATRGDAVSEVTFGDWRPIGDLRLPYSYVDRSAGSLLQTLTASAIEIDAPLPDSLFSQPSNVVTVPFPTGGPATPLANGVFLLPGNYTSLAVVYDDHVLVLEAGGSSGAAARQLAEVQRIAPGKPVRYVVSTHHHHDHLSGIRPYVAAGATIVTTPHAAAVVREAVAATHRLRPDTLSGAPRSPTIETVTTTRTFGEGDRRVVLYQIGPSPHADQMLIAYLPAQKLLFEADILDLTDGRPGPGGRDTIHLSEAIRRLGLTVDRIVSVHGGLGDARQLDAALAAR